MSKNIALIGLMGSGKTTVAKLLSNELGKTFIDIDNLIEENQQKTINEIFITDGEAYFRQIESNIVQEVSKRTNMIVSTGGGVVEKPENIEVLKTNSILFYLSANAEILYSRIADNKDRPLLKTDNPLQILENLLKKREPMYKLAHFTIITENKSPEEITKEIITKFKSIEK